MNTLQTDRQSAAAPHEAAPACAGAARPAAAESAAATTPPAPLTPGQPAAPAAFAGVRNALLVTGVMLLPILIFFSTAATFVAIWNSSGTYAHGYVILPISLWLIWRRRAELATLPVKPYWPGLVLLAGSGAVWLLADLVEVQTVRQYAFAAMLPLTVLALLGVRIARAISFPLVFILFSVPVGDSLTPPLIDITANFTIDALRLTGIPVLRDGNSFSIPSGNWSVVEACSGLRYLISSITLGCLYAYLTYQTPWRRALFILASILMPIAANGARAYMIVMIGHLSGMRLAVGVDHLIYGWVFFGIVVMLLFWVGSFWREEEAGVSAADPGRSAAASFALPVQRMAATACASIAILGAWAAYASHLDNEGPGPAVSLLGFRPAAPAAGSFTDWKPDFPVPSGQHRSFHATATLPVGIEARYYRDQTGGAKLISTSNHMGWNSLGLREVSTVQRRESIGGTSITLNETLLTDGVAGRRMLLWHWYWIGGEVTTSNYVGKLLQLKQKLLTGSGDGAVVMVFSQYDENPDNARAALREFLSSNLSQLDSVLSSNKRP